MSKTILSGGQIKELSALSIDKRNNILQRKQEKYLNIFIILSRLGNRTDKKGLSTKKRYYKTLYYIYEDINNIRDSIFDEGEDIKNIEGFVHFEDTHTMFTRNLSLYRENFKLDLSDKAIIFSYIKEIPQSKVIKLLKEVLLEKRLGLRKYKPKKK